MSSEDQIKAESVVISAANQYMPEGRLDTGSSFPQAFSSAQNVQSSDETQESEKPEAPALHYRLDSPGLGGSDLSIADVVKISAQSMPEKTIQTTEEKVEKDQIFENPIKTSVSLSNDFDNSNGI